MKTTRRQALGFGIAAAAGLNSISSRAASVDPAPKVAQGTLKPCLKLSLAAYSFRNYLPQGDKKGSMTLEDLFEMAAVWNLDAVEPTSYYFTSEDMAYVNGLKTTAFKLGLDISGTAIRNNFCLPADEREPQLAHVRKWVDIAAELGAPCIRVFAGRKAAGHTEEQDFAWTVDGMKAACDYAGTRGIILALENHGYLTDAADALQRFLDAVDHPWFGINLDTGNFTTDPYKSMERIAPKAVNVQVKVKVRGPNGGRVDSDFGRIADILRAANYRGYVALEYEDKEDPKTAVPRHLAALREVMEP